MSLYRRKGSPFWWYSAPVNGRRIRGSTKQTSRKEAKIVEAKKIAAASQVLSKSPKISLDLATGRYISEHAIHLPSADTIGYQITNIVSGLKPNIRLDEIDDATLAEYIAKRRATVSNGTVNREITTLRAIMRRAQQQWGIKLTVMPNWRAHMLPEPKERRRYLSEDEKHRLLAVLRPDYVPLVNFCLLTGARIGSALALEWKDIDYVYRTITFRSMKGGGTHMIPLNDELIVLLANERGNHNEKVFTYRVHKKRIDPKKKVVRLKDERLPFVLKGGGWAKIWRAALKAAEITDFRFHDLRHTAATNMLKKTGNLAGIQVILGHADIQTTKRYAHVQMDTLREIMDSVTKSGTNEPNPMPKLRQIKEK